MSRAWKWLFAAGFLLVGCATAPRLHVARASAPESSLVLLLNLRQDASLVYGTAVAVDDAGNLATATGLVSHSFSLVAVPYEALRGVREGDLARFLYEHRPSMVPAQLLRSDAQSGIAIVRVDGLGTVAPAFTARSQVSGDVLSALGALAPPRAVRVMGVEAAGMTFEGESAEGSALFDAQGALAAIDVQGGARAQPIARVQEMLAQTLAVSPVDLSSPERGFSSCSRALRLGSADFLRCMDWESRRRVVREAFILDSHQDGLGAERIAELMPALERAQPQMLAVQREVVLTQLRGGEAELALRLRDTPRGQAPYFKRIQDMDPSELSYRLELSQHGALRTPVGPSPGSLPLLELARRGVTVKATHYVTPDAAWLLISSQDEDGRELRFTQLLRERQGEWLQDEFPTAEETATRPQGWPAPLGDLERILAYLFRGETPSSARR